MSILQICSLAGLGLFCLLLLLPLMKKPDDPSFMQYFFGGRRLPFWALSLSFIASWWGAGSALSTVDLAFEDGLGAFWYYGMPVLIASFLIFLGSKRIRRIGFLTQGIMMEKRYSKLAAFLLSCMILAFMTFSAASQMVGMGMFFGTYLGISYESAVLCGTAVVVAYSVSGGFRAVVITDIIQFIFLLLSVVLVCVVAFSHAGGWENIKNAAAAAGKSGILDFTAGAGKYLMYVITFGCSWMIQANVWQRISAARSDSDAGKMSLMSLLVYIPLYLIPVFTGIAAIAIFPDLPGGGIVPAIVTQYMSPFTGALVFVGISAAIMSTMDSLINTGAMTLAVDLRRDAPEASANITRCRWATVLVSLAALLIALRIRSILEVSWIASDIITTGAFVPLLGGFFWRGGNNAGAVASMGAGFCYCGWNFAIACGLPLPSFWEAQSAQQVLTGVGLSVVMYVFFSLISAENQSKADNFLSRAAKGTV